MQSFYRVQVWTRDFLKAAAGLAGPAKISTLKSSSSVLPNLEGILNHCLFSITSTAGLLLLHADRWEAGTRQELRVALHNSGTWKILWFNHGWFWRDGSLFPSTRLVKHSRNTFLILYVDNLNLLNFQLKTNWCLWVWETQCFLNCCWSFFFG